jgi:hypothetical protein
MRRFVDREKLVKRTHGASAYSRYNSHLRKIVSFCPALEHRPER